MGKPDKEVLRGGNSVIIDNRKVYASIGGYASTFIGGFCANSKETGNDFVTNARFGKDVGTLIMRREWEEETPLTEEHKRELYEEFKEMHEGL